MRAVVAAIANEDPNQREAALEQRAKACVQPAIQWFLRKFNVDFYDAVTALKAARVMCPVTVGWLRPTRASVEALRIFHSLTMTRQSTVLAESCHSKSLLLRMWLLNAKEEKLSGGRSTNRGFLIGLLRSRKSYLFNLLLLPQKEFLALRGFSLDRMANNTPKKLCLGRKPNAESPSDYCRCCKISLKVR